MTDAVVVGSGPNGLAAAIALAQRGLRVQVHEANETIGGGCRTAELTLPGFRHDTCSAVHPLGAASPFFSSLDLGVEWIHPDAPIAHPLDDGPAVIVERSVEDTAAQLGPDRVAWRRTVGAVARDWDALIPLFTGPALHLPRHPLAEARFGALAVLPVAVLAGRLFRGARARAVLAGCAAHSFLPLTAPLTSAFALTLAASAHAVGWPMPRGGSGALADALVTKLRSLGGEVITGSRVGSIGEVDDARAYLFDTSPRDLQRIAGARLPDGYRRALRRYRYGPGVFKVDYALDGPVPWRDPAVARAGTVHVGGSFEQIRDGEAEVSRGRHADRPFVLVAQPSAFDPSRAPAGRHVLWAYCHVPNGSTEDMTARIEAQIERFAPGFHDRILARHVMDTGEVERRNANYVGGDISCGAHSGLQFIARPALRIDPYATPDRSIYLCSAATPPGGGVHGMCGFHAARSALARRFS